MAEVSGIIAGAMAVLDVSTRGVERLTQLCARWNHAPGELLSLRNELEDLRVVLDRFRGAEIAIEAASRLDTLLAAALVNQIRSADEHVNAMIEILDQLLSLKKFKKKYRWIRQEGRIETLKGQIRGAREGINSLLLTHDAVKSTRVELDILSMAIVSPQWHQAVASTPDAPVIGTPEDGDEVAVLDGLQKSLLFTTTTATESRLLESSLADPNIEAADILREMVSQLDMGLDRLIVARHKTSHLSRADGDPRPGPRLQSSQLIEFSTARPQSCPPGCNCRCHINAASSHENLPKILAFVVGSLFLCYTGLPASFAQCHPDCRTRRQSSIRFTYVFPIWFLQYCVFIYLKRITSRGPKLVLEPKNRVPWNENPMFNACYWGNLEEVKRLYRISPWLTRDLRKGYGTNALFCATSRANVDIVRFLLARDGGADNVGDDGHCVASWFASRNISRLDKLTPAESEIYQLLGVREYIDGLSLPEITRSILRLPGSLPLKDVVRDFPTRSTSEAKMGLDELGMTVLHWACGQGDGDAVDLLVKLGANVNATTRTGFTPLHKAATSKTPSDCINTLLRAGAIIREDEYGNTPLHTASFGGTAEAVQSLLEHGMSTEEVDNLGRKPLIHAALGKKFSTLKCLLDNGADIRSTDHHGRTALHHCIWQNAHECIEELLQRGAHAHIIDDMGHGILQIAAVGGDVETLKIFTQHGIPGIDIDSEGNNYRVAKQYFKSRQDVTKELQEAFDRLLEVVLAAAAKSKELEEEGK